MLKEPSGVLYQVHSPQEKKTHQSLAIKHDACSISNCMAESGG